MSVEDIIRLKKEGRHAEAQALFQEIKNSKVGPNIMKSNAIGVTFYKGKQRLVQDEEGNWIPYSLKKRVDIEP